VADPRAGAEPDVHGHEPAAAVAQRLDAAVDHDDADAVAGRRVECPALVLWGGAGFVGRAYDVLEVWRGYAADVRGRALPGGHFLAEEAPEDTLAALREFLGRG
jgi:haloacetate dehalogenase